LILNKYSGLVRSQASTMVQWRS